MKPQKTTQKTPSNELKFCKKCSFFKPQTEFYKASKNLDGLQYSCKVCQDKVNAVWSTKNLDKRKAYDKKSYYKYQSKRVKKSSTWNLVNREQYLSNKKKNSAFRRKTDPVFKLKQQLRIRLNTALKRGSIKSSAVKNLGCSIEEFKVYLESKFKPGMTWENWTINGWHIDHIIPLASFDFSDPEQVLVACNFKNLQPLWAAENLKKGAK